MCGGGGCCCCYTEVIIPTKPITPDADEIKKQENNVENCVVVWFNPTPPDEETIKDNKNHLKKNFYAVLRYSDPDECKKRIENIKNDKVFLILTGGVQKNFVKTAVNELTQIDSIYQYALNGQTNTDYSKEFPGIHKPRDDFGGLCVDIKKDMKVCDKNLVGYSFFDPHTVNKETQMKPAEISSTYKQKSSESTKGIDKGVDHQRSGESKKTRLVIHPPENNGILTSQKEVPFMYLQLFKEIILNFKENEHISDAYALINANYSDNNKEMGFLQEIKAKYYTKPAAHWYTAESCLYTMLNKALRMYEYDTLYSLRTFIRHLHEQLTEEHKKISAENMLKLYRGQAFEDKDFRPPPEKDQFISFANFLSTSTDEKVARKFANDTVGKPHSKTYLMKITVSKNNSIPFADITKLSYFKNEAECLFTIGSVLRITFIQHPTEQEKIGRMNLELVDFHDPQLVALREHLKSYLEEDNNYMNMARLMHNLGKWERSIYFHELALKQENKWQRKAAILNNMGTTYMNQNDFDKALKCFREVLEIETKNQNENYSGLASTYNNIGTVYYGLNEIDKADKYFKKAIESHDMNEKNDQELTAAIFSNIASVLNSKCEHAEALICLEKSLKIRINIYPDIHPTLAVTFNCIATTCYHLGESAKEIGDNEGKNEYNQRAIDYAHKAIDMDEKSLPDKHPQTKLHKKNLEYFEPLPKPTK